MKYIPITADEPVPIRYRIWWKVCGWAVSTCKLLTRHRWRKLEAIIVRCCDGELTEYYYKCLVCREGFWNYTPPTRKKDIKRLEAWKQEEEVEK